MRNIVQIKFKIAVIVILSDVASLLMMPNFINNEFESHI